ncbi:uncharacterized protein LOC118741718 [Rhagoletis pomonella]|uniref:uncharacterized protein LOC118741718 n=1 Tax=Rhagoletis pomonella TaxID=28610 RepID=UPI0017809B66|nr:uncharacterized protein LOC118741718 [Rhagoletis pomonella]
MDLSPLLLGDTEALSPPRTSNTDVALHRKRFHVALPYEERFVSQPTVTTNTGVATTTTTSNTGQQFTLSHLLERQKEMFDGVMAAIGRVESKVDGIANALAEKMPERAEVQAQGQLLRECKVVTSKVHQSISRITGDAISKEHTLLQSMLPLSSQEKLNTLDNLLGNKPHSDAMLNIILKLKGAKGCVKHVLRSIFADTLLISYNYEHKANKAPLLGLKTIELVFDAFVSMPKIDLIAEIRKHVSHNRYKQIVIKTSKKV